MNNKSLKVSLPIRENTAATIVSIVSEHEKISKKPKLSTSSFTNYLSSNVSSLLRIKNEPIGDDEIKEYAANAMSELLGWYGYDKVDSGCTRGLNLDHFASLTDPKHHSNFHQQHSRMIGLCCVKKKNSLAGTADSQTKSSQSPQSTISHSPSTSSISAVSNRERDISQVSHCLPLKTTSASPHTLEHIDSVSNTSDSSTTCSWCGRTSRTWESGNASLPCGINNNFGRFCSEACFSAGRRAAFKRSRTCDWCRHVRHSISYVDFQDGESQLQFCSDKCLNQYKMNIFCRETQAHLALQGLASLSSNNSVTSGELITPELWLKDCQSPSSSTTDDEALIVDDEPSNWPTYCAENYNVTQKILENTDEKLLINGVETFTTVPQKIHGCDNTMNNIFHDETEEAIRESLKDEEERKIKKYKAEMNALKSFQARLESTSSIINEENPSKYLSHESSSNCTRGGMIYLKDVRKLLEKNNEHIPYQTADSFSQKISKSPMWHAEDKKNYQLPPSGITIHQPFLSHPMPIKFSSTPEYLSTTSSTTMAQQSTLHTVNQKISPNSSQTGLLPPVTVLVPYPIPIPIPIPLPIPIPIPLFGKFFNSNTHNLCKTKQQNNIPTVVTADTNIPEISIVPEDLSQRGSTKYIPKENQLINIDDNATIRSNSSISSSPTLPSATVYPPFSTTQVTDMALVLPKTLKCVKNKSSRKRRSQSAVTDKIDIKRKRRSKFVSV